jgi:hypothetical protein
LQGTSLYQYFSLGKFKGFDAKTLYAVTFDFEHRLTWDSYALDIKTLEVFDDGTESYYWACKR